MGRLSSVVLLMSVAACGKDECDWPNMRCNGNVIEKCLIPHFGPTKISRVFECPGVAPLCVEVDGGPFPFCATSPLQPCDPPSYVSHCEGNVAYSCQFGLQEAHDCNVTLDPPAPPGQKRDGGQYLCTGGGAGRWAWCE